MLNQGKRILLTKIPPDVTADFRAVSGQRKHFKAGTGFLANYEPTLKFDSEDMEIKRIMGIGSNAKLASEVQTVSKRSVTQLEHDQSAD